MSIFVQIIDYGVGEFNETLAQAAGGYLPELVVEKIHQVFEQKGIPVGPEAAVRVLKGKLLKGNVCMCANAMTGSPRFAGKSSNSEHRRA